MGVSLGSMWLAGSKRRSAWIVSFLAQIPWATYGILTDQWGFVVSSAGFAAVAVRNYFKWR